jgi:hypothetical protein
VADLASPANRIVIGYPSGHIGPAFRVAGLVVWGFTATVLDQLLELGGWAKPWDSGTVTTLGPAEQPVGWPSIGS